LFKQQLKKDFEGAGLTADFVNFLPAEFEELTHIAVFSQEFVASQAV
jgi:hypothetical protein